MADLSDAEAVIVSTLAQIIYPSGTSQPSIINAPCKIYRGWPVPANLDTDLAAGTTNISVFPQNTEQKTTRYQQKWIELPVVAPTLTLTASHYSVTVGGTPASCNAAVLVNGKAYVYPVQPDATPTQVATALAELISADTPATSSGPVIRIPGAKQLVARVGAHGTLIRELKRQKRGIQISFWCPSPQIRDQIVAPCDVALASLTFLALPDGSSGRILYQRTAVTDQIEKAAVYRRDLFYSVEYPTTDTLSTAQIVAEMFNLPGANFSI